MAGVSDPGYSPAATVRVFPRLVARLQPGNALVVEAPLRHPAAMRSRYTIREPGRPHFIGSMTVAWPGKFARALALLLCPGLASRSRVGLTLRPMELTATTKQSFEDKGVPKLEFGHEEKSGLSTRTRPRAGIQTLSS